MVFFVVLAAYSTFSARCCSAAQYFLTTILLWFIWMTNSFVYYGLVLFSQSYFETIAQNALLVTLITSAAELPGVLLVVLLIDRAGRRRTQAICFFVCGLTTLLLLIPHLPEKIIVLFSVVSRACIFGAYATSYVFSTEAYPSEIRGTGLAAAAALAKVASIVTPFVAYSNPTIPLAVYGGCAIIASAASMALPFDTAGGQLKDFVDETPGNDATAAADGDKHATTASGAGSGERQPLLE